MAFYLETFAFEILFSLGILSSLVFFTAFKEKINVSSAVNFAVILLFLLMYVNGFQENGKAFIFNQFYIFDNLSKYARYLVCFLSILSLIATKNYIVKSGFTFEYVIVLLFAIFGLCLLLNAYDFISIYLTLELQSLAFYVLAASRKDSSYSVEAGLKYFILGSFASALMIFGMSLIYALTGITQLNHLSTFVVNLSFSTKAEAYIFMFSVCLMLSGILFKLGAAPFHMWVPEIYEGSPTSVSLFFAVVPKVVLFALLYRICNLVLQEISEEWFFLIFASSLLSLAMGSFGGLRQTKLKRLMAFSSINHVGYILLGVLSCTNLGVVGLVIYVTVYSFSSLLIWSIFIGIEALDENGKEYTVKYMTDLKDFVSANKILASILALTLFSMAGVPPLAGFFGKAYILLAAIEAKMYFAAVVSIIFSLISAFYYLRFVKQIFTDYTGYSRKIYFKEMNQETADVVAFVFLLLVTFVVFSDFFMIPACYIAYSI
jgi:NADH-quinone oxidoreductase subunit N